MSLFGILKNTKRTLIKTAQNLIESLGFTIARKGDYFSPLPAVSVLRKNEERWNKPSGMGGVNYDITRYERALAGLMSKYLEEYRALPDYSTSCPAGFAPTYPALDAMVLYMILREKKPAKWLEAGSGLTTFFCGLAAERNAAENSPLNITCVDPFPAKALYDIAGIEIIKDEVQNIDAGRFAELNEGDVLFIDSTHVIKIDGDVPFLYLEVLPALKKGVIVHAHDISFPYNVPYPPELWILGDKPWPAFWNEAMLLQAFLCSNPGWEIIMSTPLIRYHDETFLKKNIPGYKTVKEAPNTFSSIWLEKIK